MNTQTFVGNLTADPVLRSKSGQTPRATFRLAVSEQRGEDNEVTHFLDFTAWGTLAENVVESLKKGTRLVVLGRVNTYEQAVEIDGEGKKIIRVSFTATAVGPDLRWATVEVERNQKANASNGKAKRPAQDDDEDEAPAPKAKARAGASRKAAAAFDDDDDF